MEVIGKLSRKASRKTMKEEFCLSESVLMLGLLSCASILGPTLY